MNRNSVSIILIVLVSASLLAGCKTKASEPANNSADSPKKESSDTIRLPKPKLKGAGKSVDSTDNGNPETGTRELTVSEAGFEPSEIKIKAGTKVVWKNTGEADHLPHANDGSWESPSMAPGQTYERVFDQPGSVFYHCHFHSENGIITVE